MTQLKSARANKVTPQMEMVAKAEGVPVSYILEGIKAGHIVLTSNINRWKKLSSAKKFPAKAVCGIGKGLKTKVNANLGTSSDYADINIELKKLKAAEESGADAVMDLSTGGDIKKIRQTLLNKATVSFGTVPIYEAIFRKGKPKSSVCDWDDEILFKTIEQHAKDGVDFITIHSGVTRDVVSHLDKEPRVGGVVSRGGAILTAWMKANGEENPLYEKFDRVIDIAREYDVTLSLGDGLRPGAIADSFDKAQIKELMVLSRLAKEAKKADVQVMIEGPGHVPLNQIQAQVLLEKQLCDGAPFYVLGPLVTDIAPGYDHITSAIGGALAAWAGADFLCYVTPMEHLGLPSEEHVREGVIASRIAAHAADIAKGVKGAMDEDRRFSGYRKNQDWDNQIKFALDPKRAGEYRAKRKPKKDEACSMCGEICVYSIMKDK
jgi:phosphomethylpyrimidine synthase